MKLIDADEVIVKQELSRDMEEIKEIMECEEADAETKCRMISNVLTGKPHYFKLPQESKTGHWIIKDNKEKGYDIGGVKTWYIQIMCSECGFIKTAIEGHTGQYHYCPNCGARMESEE